MTSTTAAVFPGQGVSLTDAREATVATCAELYERCCELLDADPFERAGESTRFAQPAIFLASMAGWSRFAGERPLALAGHSLGELSALTAAGAFRPEEALALVVARGALMADAGERSGDGGMVAVLKGTLADAEELARAHGVAIANDNAPGQTILSGARPALEAVAADARGRGLRAIRLDVTGAFHSPAMEGARGPFLAALLAVEIAEPRIPVISGMTAAPFGDIPAELAEALVRPVRWRETLLALHALGAERYVDVGPDVVLARLTARNLEHAEIVSLEELDGVRA